MLTSYVSAQDKVNLVQAIGQVLFVFEGGEGADSRLQLGNPMTLFMSDPKLIAYYLRNISQLEFEGVQQHRDRTLAFLGSDALAVLGGTGVYKVCEDEHIKPILTFLEVMAADEANHEAISLLKEPLMKHDIFRNAYSVTKALHLKALWEGIEVAETKEVRAEVGAARVQSNPVVDVFPVLCRVYPYLSSKGEEDFALDARTINTINIEMKAVRCDSLILQIEYLLPRALKSDPRVELTVPQEEGGGTIVSADILKALLSHEETRAELKEALKTHFVSASSAKQDPSADASASVESRELFPKAVRVLVHLLENSTGEDEKAELLEIAYAACFKNSGVLASVLRFFPLPQQRALLMNSFKSDSEGLLLALRGLGEDAVMRLLTIDDPECDNAFDVLGAKDFKNSVVAVVFSYLAARGDFEANDPVQAKLKELMAFILKDTSVRLKLSEFMGKNYSVFYNLVVKLQLFSFGNLESVAIEMGVKAKCDEWYALARQTISSTGDASVDTGLRDGESKEGSSKTVLDRQQVAVLSKLKTRDLKHLP